jgi:hypothetical protein
MVLGGRKAHYPDIYDFVSRLATEAGFELEVKGEEVSSSNTVVADRIYAEGVRIYEYLQSLAPDALDESPEAQMVRSHFTESPKDAPVSQLWAYRKHRWH